MITFEDARSIVESAEQVQTAVEFGYESDSHWYPTVLPERIGGRVPAVDKTSGALSWVSSTRDAEYVSARQFGPRP